MIRRFIRRVFFNGDPQIYPARKLGIQAKQLSRGAKKTIQTLQDAGFDAYIVGGAVRDLLMGRTPKDFDIATNARPDEVTDLFRRAWVIGRRFQIVHVRQGAETLEVTTFRGEGEMATTEHGQLLRDNVFGSQVDDAARRDFSANSLYYDPEAELVYDFHHGVDDIRAGLIRIIGSPELRYREDPVRMLRAIRFSAKLGFEIETKTRKPLSKLAPLLDHISEARRFDEIIKLLVSGAAEASIKRLYHEKLHHGLFPLLDEVFEHSTSRRFVETVLRNTDDRVQHDKSINPAFTLAALLWNPLKTRWQQLKEAGVSNFPALIQAIDEVIDLQFEQVAIPKRILSDMREIWQMQPQFENRRGKRPYRLTHHPRFRAGLDFMQIRCDVGDCPAEVSQWWKLFLESPLEAEKLLEEKPENKKPRRRNRRRYPRTSATEKTEK